MLKALLILCGCLCACYCKTCPETKAEIDAACSPGMLGCKKVICSGDDFTAKQCHGSVCQCVDTQGEQIGDYSFNIGQQSSGTGQQSDCLCAREGGEDCTETGSYS